MQKTTISFNIALDFVDSINNLSKQLQISRSAALEKVLLYYFGERDAKTELVAEINDRLKKLNFIQNKEYFCLNCEPVKKEGVI